MAEAKLEIQIDVDGAAKSIGQLKGVDKAIKSIDGRNKGLASSSTSVSQTMTTSTLKLKKHFDEFDKMIKKVGTIGLKALTMSLKFATFEMLAMGAAMVAIHGAFALGNVAMKAMKATLGPLAAGMTAIVAAASAAAAAIREQQAAMFAYKTKSSPEFGSGLNQTRQVMRTLHSDVELATVGVENLNTAYATVSKTGTFTARSQVILKGLMDFASAGQPIEEGVKKAGELIALLQNSKKSFSESKKAAEGMFGSGDEMKAAFKKLNITTKKGLEEAILSGKLASAAGVEGQFEAVSGTLINRLKGYFNLIKVQFGDLGQPLLKPIKKSAYEIFNILRRGFVKISGNTQKFGMTSMLDGLVSMVDKLTTWSTNLINNNIQSVDGMFEKMAGWWKDFRYGWNEVLDKLRPFIDGARVIEKMFGAVWGHVKNIVSSSFGQFNEWLIENEATVVEFGDKVGKLITSIIKFQTEMKKILQDLMPFINDIVGGISAMVDQMTGFIKLLRGLTGGGTIGALASLLAIRGGLSAMKGTKGGFTAVQKITTQPIQANQVVINTPSVVSGGGSLGTTRAALRGGTPGGLASATFPGVPIGGVVPMGGGGAGGGGAGGGGPAYGTFRGGFLPPAPVGPSSPLHQPMFGQPGYASPTSGFGKFEYDNFVKAGKTEEELMKIKAQRTNRQGQLTRRAKMAQRSMALREARSGENMSTGNRRIGKFQGSAGAKMGTGMLLGAASQFAPEEAQGALALGSAVSMVNPLAGIGVAGLGTAFKSETAAGGMMSGAAGGAAMGAMVGSMVGPLGTAAGAAAGALLGAVSGGIMGSINRGKRERKEAREAAANATQSIMNNVLSGVLDATRKEGPTGKSSLRTALSDVSQKQGRSLGVVSRGLNAGTSGDYMNPGEIKKQQQKALKDLYVNQKSYGMTISQKEFAAMLKKPVEALSKMKKEMETNEKVMGPLQDKYNSRMDELNRITGKSDIEINNLAKTMGVNLMDGTKDFNEVLKELGLTTIKTAQEMRTAMGNVFVDAMSDFDTELKKLETPEILNETAKGFKQIYKAQGGKVTDKQKVKFFSDVMEQNLAYFGGDAMKAYAQTVKSLGEGGSAFTGVGPLKGMQDVDFANNEIIQGVLKKQVGGFGGKIGEQLNAKLIASGGSIDVNKFKEQFGKMTVDEQMRAYKVAEEGIGTGQAAFRKIESANGNPMQALLNEAGFGNLAITATKKPSTDAVDITKASKDIVESTDKIIKQMEIYFTQANEAVPSWYNKAPSWWEPKDTSTPRGQAFGDTTSSRLSQTMGRHASMDSALTGTRSVTSSYRNYGLGSVNSDHVTGRAYDLVGQNLGQYQGMVRSTGGFAEFHGVNKQRHLHVVPGSGAVGDRMMPVSMSSSSPSPAGSGASGGNNYNFYITGNQNSSAGEIAEIVMQKVKETERSNRERR